MALAFTVIGKTGVRALGKGENEAIQAGSVQLEIPIQMKLLSRQSWSMNL